MREIKFRAWAWDIRNKNWPDLFLGGGGDIDINEYLELAAKDGLIIMQYTGLKDKNGKEIYEGDILFVDGWEEYKSCKPRRKKADCQGIFFVRTRLGNWGFETDWEPVSGYSCSTHIMGHITDDGLLSTTEVIGNIYENPELLKQ